MNIPYNKKSIKNCKIVKDIITLNMYGIKKGKMKLIILLEIVRNLFWIYIKLLIMIEAKIPLNLLICIKELIIKVVF